jgi:mannose-6-phosphate isomerase-like protein (cupin superfamily)
MSDQLIAPPTDRSAAARRVSLHPAETGSAAAVGPAGVGPAETHLPLATDILADIAVGLGQATALWRPHVEHDPLSRTAVRLVATDVYEAWLLGWTPTQRVELHDHGGANAAFVVLEGELTEISLGRSGPTAEQLGVGAVGTVPAGVIHDVLNSGPANATSLHVYSHPLRTMTFYDRDGTPTYTEIVEQVPALVTSASQARALHPSRRG